MAAHRADRDAKEVQVDGTGVKPAVHLPPQLQACLRLYTAQYHIITAITTRGWALNRVHNSRRTLDRLFPLCDPVPF